MANISIQDIADIIDVNAKTIRKALRAKVAKDDQPGRGARWAIDEKDIEKVRAIVTEYQSKTVKVITFDE